MNTAATAESREERAGTFGGYMLAEQKAVLRRLGAENGLATDGEILRTACKYWVESQGETWPQRIRVI